MAASGTSTAAAGLAGPGAPLEPGIRDQLCTSFGHDFASVRVHLGPEADAAARGLGAKAYTVGNDVVFSHGAYDPLTTSGRSLIAHELAHVAQHGGRVHAPSYLRTNPGAAVPDADARLERQAHAAAARWQHGLPRSWAWERASAPFLGRVGVNWTDLPAADQYQVDYAGQQRTITQEERSPDDPAGTVRVNLGEFVLPATKGPWQSAYHAIAGAGALQAVVEMSGAQPRAGLWQKRAPSEQLRRLWLLWVQWPAAQARAWWEEAGGDPSGADFTPKVKGVQSQLDHVVELQLGGTNVPENLAPHDGPDNMNSGTTIGNNVQQAARGVSTAIVAKGRPRPRQVILWFGSATQPSPYSGAVSPLATLPAADEARTAAVAARKGQAATGLQVHFTAMADLAAGTRPSAADRAATAQARAGLTPYPIAAGPSRATLSVPATPPPPQGEDAIENSEVPENHAARELISGVTLEKLRRPRSGTGPHRITGWIDSSAHPVRAGSRLPISIANPVDKELTFVVNDPGSTGRLSLQGGTKQVQFLYSYLSRGQLALSTTDDGLVGRGTITPSVPLLSRLPITVELDRRGLRGSVQADPSRLSLPPFRVTEAAVVVTLAPELSVGGTLAFAIGSLVTGRATAGLDAQGLFARGEVQAHVPGLDEASGQVEYRPATGPTGFVVARASRPGGLVRGGEVRVDVAGNTWSVGGRLDLMLPGNSPATLSVRRQDARVVYRGNATLTVPGLRPVDVALTYDGEHLSGSARTTFVLLGATGEIALRYRDGRFSGDGSVQLQRGRFSGRLDAHLDENGRISGRGTGSLTLRPGLVGTVGVEYAPDGRFRVTGELRFPPYRFLEPRGNRYVLFNRSLPAIPIFAIPLGIGSVGLVATIGASLAARYQFGPGEIRDMVIRAALNPLDEDMNAEVAAEARLVLPAEAGLELSLRAGIGASVVIATASGGITVTGGVLLRGGLNAGARLSYARSVLVFDARAEISARPLLTLRIEADLMIEAAVGGPWRWPYELASYQYDPGLQFGMIAPFHYQSDQPLRLPSPGDIQWIVPEIDVRALAERISSQVRRGIGV